MPSSLHSRWNASTASSSVADTYSTLPRTFSRECSAPPAATALAFPCRSRTGNGAPLPNGDADRPRFRCNGKSSRRASPVCARQRMPAGSTAVSIGPQRNLRSGSFSSAGKCRRFGLSRCIHRKYHRRQRGPCRESGTRLQLATHLDRPAWVSNRVLRSL